MHKGLKDLLTTGHSALCILLVLAATALVFAGKLSADQWLSYTKWISTALVASGTVTNAIGTMTGSNAPDSAQAPPSAHS